MRVLSALLVTGALLAVSACDTTSTGGPPRSARILKVTVSDAPLTDVAGDGWDGGSNPLSDGPEIYFRLFDSNVDYVSDPGSDRLNPRDDGNVYAQASSQAWYEGVNTADFPLVWDVDPGYVVRDLDDPLYVALFDYDPTNADDPMAESEVFTLFDVAPRTVDGLAEIIDLDGFDRNGDAIADFSVRLTVLFDD